MAKKPNYVFPIERNSAIEVVKIIRNFYLLEGASAEQLMEKRSGPSTQLLLGGLAPEAITQELLNNIYANLNNVEELISLVKEKFQSINYENALYILRWTKDSQNPYYPRMQGDKPVEQFNEDYDLARNLLVAYINDHSITAIKNLPARVVYGQKDLIINMANDFRASAINEARSTLTTNQEALVALRQSIKEQKQKIADLKAANPDAQTAELEEKLKEDRLLAIEKYKIVNGQRRSLKDLLQQKALLYREFADVVGGKTTNKAQVEAECEESDEKLELEKKVLDLVKKSPSALPYPEQALGIITKNVKCKFNKEEVESALGFNAQQPQQVFPQQEYQEEQVNEENSVDDQPVYEANDTDTDVTTDDNGQVFNEIYSQAEAEQQEEPEANEQPAPQVAEMSQTQVQPQIQVEVQPQVQVGTPSPVVPQFQPGQPPITPQPTFAAGQPPITQPMPTDVNNENN